MKKILEVIQCDDGELKFNTDVDVRMNPGSVIDLSVKAMYSMATSLWGDNEQAVIAVIRALFVADMAISVDRDIILKGLGERSEEMGEIFIGMMNKLQAQGKATAFYPGRPVPSKERS